MNVGVMRLFPTVKDAVSFTRDAARLGFDTVGFGDSPFLYADPYASMAAALDGTEPVRLAPCATNAVSRHWSVHAATFRAFDEMAPGRTWLVLATGNSAVRAAGRAPQSLTDLETAVKHIREHGPPGLEIFLAAGGRGTARVAGRIADGMLLGAGLDADVIGALLEAAEAGRREVGDSRPVRRWLHTPYNLGDERAVDEILNALIGYSRQALAFTFDGKAVPDELHKALRDLFAAYDYSSHGRPGTDHSNTQLLKHLPESGAVRGFLVDRFALVGSPALCADRLRQLERQCQLDGVFLSMPVRNPGQLLVRTATELMPLL